VHFPRKHDENRCPREQGQAGRDEVPELWETLSRLGSAEVPDGRQALP